MRAHVHPHVVGVARLLVAVQAAILFLLEVYFLHVLVQSDLGFYGVATDGAHASVGLVHRFSVLLKPETVWILLGAQFALGGHLLLELLLALVGHVEVTRVEAHHSATHIAQAQWPLDPVFLLHMPCAILHSLKLLLKKELCS